MASAGLMTVVHNDAPPEEMLKRIFLHAMEPDYPIGYPIEWLQEVHNHQVLGNIAFNDLPVNVIVGFADVVTRKKPPYPLMGAAASIDRFSLVLGLGRITCGCQVPS